MLRSTCARLPLLAATFACAATPHLASAAPPKDLDISVDVDVGEPLMIAGAEQNAYIKITLGGFALPDVGNRPPINLAIVIDRSASMASDDKLEKAKEAALMVLDRLQPDDFISVITYDSTVSVIVPSMHVGPGSTVREQISALTPQGSTALFAGVSTGIEEVSKHLDLKRVNRIILLSDGQANVGPRSPNELGKLGEVAGRQGISITTIGMGLDYNEDLMTQLALASDGNHAFAENSVDLTNIFQHELGDVLSVVAQDVDVDVSFDDGITPVRALGRDVQINGRKARFSLNQLYASQQKYVLFEVKVPPGAAGKSRQLANVDVNYSNMISKKRGSKHAPVAVAFAAARTQVAEHQNKKVMEAAVEAIATDENRRAVALRDAGRAKEAKQVLQDNAKYLAAQAQQLESERLKSYSRDNSSNADNVLDQRRWNETRKSMRAKQTQNSTNQSWE